ncbi:alpha/beta fold hydrolase [Roseibacterium sp. SDUM158016]|uniref:alpha/beta fold hydrolase BchO n=1 Tax=Roseicyclus sediminis TaxID=2980997 RepID=UPI0021D01DD2|nr:alpha/beta fold hydrolase BchO [Roseibacterium sp. SDUM158016]MCU4652338.1 alpha/beta fold hydrolase [Roseibacterium sp. SDUM158016]
MTPGLPPEDWPLRAASRIVASAPHRWHVQIEGTGPDMLLLHGAGASAHSWHRLMPRLDERFRLIAPDLPGHGWTRSPRGRSGLPQVARDIAALMTEIGASPRVIVGHSAGGAIALEIARQGLMELDRIVVINGALEDFKGPAGVLFPIMARVLAVNPFTGLFLSRGGSTAQVRSLIGATGTDLDEAALSHYARLIARREHVDGTLAMMAQWSLRELNASLPGISVPTLFLHGDRDQAVRIDVAERAAAAMPDARLVTLKGIGHLAQEEAPDLVADEILRFTAPAASAAAAE